MTNTNVHAYVAPPLPSTSAGMLEMRKLKSKPNINDEVEAIVLSLMPDASFRLLVEAIYDEHAVEGGLLYDDFEAARLVREAALAAPEGRFPLTSAEKLRGVVRALRVVMRRYNTSRTERRAAAEAAHTGLGEAFEAAE